MREILPVTYFYEYIHQVLATKIDTSTSKNLAEHKNATTKRVLKGGYLQEE